MQGDIKAPKVEIEGPEIEGLEGGFKMPKMKMPSFGMKGPKLEGPDVDVKIPKADIDLNAPEFDIEGPEGKNQGLQIQDAIRSLVQRFLCQTLTSI